MPKYTGQAAYIFSYDVAYEMARTPVRTLLGQEATQFRAVTGKRAPRDPFFYCPQTVRLPETRRTGPRGVVAVQRTIKLFPVGSVSIAVRIPITADGLDDLAACHDPRFDGESLQSEIRALAGEVVRDLGPLLVRPMEPLRDEEAYTVFCLDPASLTDSDSPFDAATWLLQNRRAAASLLTRDDASLLSEQEIEDTIGHYLTYRRDDLVLADWNAALVIDTPRDTEEVLHVIELANVQRTELEAYDRILDDALGTSYRDLSRRRGSGTRAGLRELREIRVDLSRLRDEVSGAAKFFGDWHLARVYQRLFVLFHLAEWERIVDDKLQTLDELYQILRQDQMNRWMLVLEATIVILFVLDLALLVLGLQK